MPEVLTPEEVARKVLADRQELSNRQELASQAPTVADEPLSWSNVGQRMAEYPQRWFTPQSDSQKAQNTLSVLQARNAIDQRAIPLQADAKRIERQVLGRGGAWQAAEDIMTAEDRARHPKERDITSFERSDSEDMPVRKYSQADIERVKKAIAAASSK